MIAMELFPPTITPLSFKDVVLRWVPRPLGACDLPLGSDLKGAKTSRTESRLGPLTFDFASRVVVKLSLLNKERSGISETLAVAGVGAKFPGRTAFVFT